MPLPSEQKDGIFSLWLLIPWQAKVRTEVISGRHGFDLWASPEQKSPATFGCLNEFSQPTWPSCNSVFYVLLWGKSGTAQRLVRAQPKGSPPQSEVQWDFFLLHTSPLNSACLTRGRNNSGLNTLITPGQGNGCSLRGSFQNIFCGCL